MAALVPNTTLAKDVTATSTCINLVDGYQDICAIVREPGHVVLSVGTEKVLVTGCQSGGKLSVLRGAQRTCPSDWTAGVDVCYVETIAEAPEFTACATKTPPTCGCGQCGD